eukprot:2555820-Ditylum_brightwellii.AAC.1
MPIITILPIIQAVGLFVFCIPWGIFMAYLASSGEITAECMCSLDQDDDTEDSLILLNSTNISNSTNGTAIISDDSTGCGEGGGEWDFLQGAYPYIDVSFGNCSIWIAHYCDNKDNTRDVCVHTEKVIVETRK